MKAFSLFLCLFALGACRPKQKFQCNMDIQCGVGAYCDNGGCLVPAASCSTGYRDYSSSDCVQPPARDAAVELADMAEPMNDDLAAPPIDVVPDMTAPEVVPDMAAPTCAQKGQACTVGTGACARTGTVVCTAPNVPSCNATAGSPDSSWHTSAAPNGSWDWDCNGQIEYQYPSGTTTAPNNAYSSSQCDPPNQEAGCARQVWIWDGTPSDPHGCGTTASADTCVWQADINLCNDGPTVMRNTVVGCH